MSGGPEKSSRFHLFRKEAEPQILALQVGITHLGDGSSQYPAAGTLEALTHASHCLEDAARLVGLDVIVKLTHILTEHFAAAQHGHALNPQEIARIRTATAWLACLQAIPETDSAAWFTANAPAIESFAGTGIPQSIFTPDDSFPLRARRPARARHVRIAAERFDQILTLASETLVASGDVLNAADQFERDQRTLARALQIADDPDTSDLARRAAQREIDRQAAAFLAHLDDLNLDLSAQPPPARGTPPHQPGI